MLLKVIFACFVCSSHAFFTRSREAKNSKLLNWAESSVEASASPLDLASAQEMETEELMKSIAALNQAEVAKENFRLLDRMLGQKSRRGKEGQDLLDPLQLRLLEGADDQMDPERQGSVRQVDSVVADSVSEEENSSVSNSVEGAEEEVRCIKKVMQVEETVWDNRVRCEHRFSEKCHDTYITDYVPTQEEDCQTSFKKNCHITYKPTRFTDTVEVCNEGLEKVCSNTTVGEEVCRTHYETSCETRFKEHEVEQDEPVCEMVTERKCRDVQVPLSLPAEEEERGVGVGSEARRQRQATGEEEEQQGVLSLGQECEDWPVQRCTLEKKNVKKVNPETACRKIPREICAPSNCEFQPATKVCREEQQDLIQNIPTEDCSLEPQEDCRMETVLVPRLILQPNCIKVPKEVCVEAKVNPRKVKKPVIKEWCYKPSDLQSPSSRLALSQIFAN